MTNDTKQPVPVVVPFPRRVLPHRTSELWYVPADHVVTAALYFGTLKKDLQAAQLLLNCVQGTNLGHLVVALPDHSAQLVAETRSDLSNYYAAILYAQDPFVDWVEAGRDPQLFPVEKYLKP